MESVAYRVKKQSISLLAGLILIGSSSLQAHEQARPARSWTVGSIVNTALIFAPIALNIGEQIAALSADYQQTTFGDSDVSPQTTQFVQEILTSLQINPATVAIKQLRPEFKNTPFYTQNFGIYATNTTLFIDEGMVKNFPSLTAFLVTHAAYTNFKQHVYRTTGLWNIGMTASKAIGMYYLMKLGTQGLHSATKAIGWNAYTESSHVGMSIARFMIGGIALQMITSKLVDHASSFINSSFAKTQHYSLCNESTDMNNSIAVLLDLFIYASQYPAVQENTYQFIQKMMTACLQHNNIHQWMGAFNTYEIALNNDQALSDEANDALTNLRSYLCQIQEP